MEIDETLIDETLLPQRPLSHKSIKPAATPLVWGVVYVMDVE